MIEIIYMNSSTACGGKEGGRKGGGQKAAPLLATFSKNQDFLIFGKNKKFPAGCLDFETLIFLIAYTRVTQ